MSYLSFIPTSEDGAREEGRGGHRSHKPTCLETPSYYIAWIPRCTNENEKLQQEEGERESGARVCWAAGEKR